MSIPRWLSSHDKYHDSFISLSVWKGPMSNSLAVVNEKKLPISRPLLVQRWWQVYKMKDTGSAEWCKFVRYGQHRSYLEVGWVMKTNYYPLPYFFPILRPNQPHFLEARWRFWTGGGLPSRKNDSTYSFERPLESTTVLLLFVAWIEDLISVAYRVVNELKIWIKNLT